MSKTIISFIIFVLISAKPIDQPFTIEIDNEQSQRYDKKYGVWQDNYFEEKEVIENKKIKFEEDKFIFPLTIKKINDHFCGKRYHLGVDYYGKENDIVVSSFDGYVIEVGYRYSVGKYIIIKNEKKQIYFLYGHLSKIYVTQNSDVQIGQIIGRVGNTGHSTGNHLHLEIYYQNIYMNHNLIFD